MRTLITGMSLTALLALGAAACGGSSGPGSAAGSNGALDPSGGTSSARPSASPSASASTAAAAGVATFPFAADVKVDFQSPLPASGPKRAAVIAYENYVDSVWYAIETHGKSTAYEKYTSGNVLAGAKQLISEFTTKHWTLRGTVSYYDVSVPQVFYGNGAVVQACADVSGFHYVMSDGKVGGLVYPAKYARYQEQSATGNTKHGYWIVNHTTSTAATSGGAAGMCV